MKSIPYLPIEKYSFSKIVVNGVTYTNDIKIVQGSVIPDWWRKKGHSVDIEDIQDILKSNPNVLVIGKGQPGMMKCSRSLRRFLKKNEIELIEEKTSHAITTYNSLLKQETEVSAGFLRILLGKQSGLPDFRLSQSVSG